MNPAISALVLLPTAGFLPLHAQTQLPAFEAVKSSATTATIDNHKAIRVIKDPAVTKDDEPTFAKLTGSNFQNGTIEAKVLSKLLPDAPAHARGFIGVAFRINDNNSKFECIYIRPTNGRSGDQLRRNRSIQYFSYPEYKFDRMRKEAPAKYESYADMGLEEWIDLKIVVKGERATLFLNNNPQPALIVGDLKHGAANSGGIGLWVDIGSEGFFRDVKVSQK